MLSKLKNFFRSDKPVKWHFNRCFRIIVQAVRSFTVADGQLRAAALTFYTMFVMVPVLALLFGVAKGFELEIWLKNSMLEKAPQHSEVLNWLFSFAERTLQHTRGGLVAGVGALMLCWSVIKMVSNIENAVNGVWHVAKPRTIFRKFTDYLSFLIIVPLLLLATGSVALMVSRMLNRIADTYYLLSFSKPLVEFGLHCMPYLVAWILFTFIGIFLPNTRVRFRAALFGGVIAGTLYQLLQAGYFFVQVALARYNVIYGSFSALPLFLIWSYLNWMVVLFGVTLSYLYQNYDYQSDLEGDQLRSPGEKRLLAMLITARVVRDFEEGKTPLNGEELAVKMAISISLTQELLGNLVERRILAPLANGEYNSLQYIPAMPTAQMTLLKVLDCYDNHNFDVRTTLTQHTDRLHAVKVMQELCQTLAENGQKRHITDLLPDSE